MPIIMTTENQQIVKNFCFTFILLLFNVKNNSKPSSSNNIGSAGKMQGWFKLVETIRKSGSQANRSVKSVPSSNLNDNLVDNASSRQQNLLEKSVSLADTNGHILQSPETNNTTIILNSPPIISLPPTPRQTTEDISSLEVESTFRRNSVPLLEIESTTTTTASSPASTGLKIYFHLNKIVNRFIQSRS